MHTLWSAMALSRNCDGNTSLKTEQRDPCEFLLFYPLVLLIGYATMGKYMFYNMVCGQYNNTIPTSKGVKKR